MTINQLIQAVKEEKLSREQLESYRDQMSNLFADMQLELAELEKTEALFMGRKPDEVSVAQRKLEFKATREGQRLIELKRYALALKELLNSLKSRIYQLIY